MSWNEPSSFGNSDAYARTARSSLRRLIARRKPTDARTMELVRAFQEGDEGAFGELYGIWFRRVRGYLSRDPTVGRDSADLTQDVFEEVLKRLPDLEPRDEQSFRKLLFTIARSRLINAKRRAARIAFVPFDELRDAMDETNGDGYAPGLEQVPHEHELAEHEGLVRSREPAEEGDPSAVLADAESLVREELVATDARIERVLGWISRDDLLEAFTLLSAPQQQALTLRFRFDLDGAAIASAMGRTPEDVRQLHSRALNKLAETIRATGERRDRMSRRRDAMLKRITPLPVLGARRFALAGGCRPPGISRSPGMARYRGDWAAQTTRRAW